MLSSRRRRSSWAYDDRNHGDFESMFRTLAGHWRPVAAVLRNAEEARERRKNRRRPERKTALPSCWSPWLLIK
jgi:hypothetical protein